MGRFEIVLGRLKIVVDSCGSFRVLVTTRCHAVMKLSCQTFSREKTLVDLGYTMPILETSQ